MTSSLQKYSGLKVALGLLQEYRLALLWKMGLGRSFCKARTVPYALRPKVEAKLEKLEKEGILLRVDWAE